MTKGLKVPVAWPHDGSVHDKGTGEALKDQYKNFGANMLPTHAINRGTGKNDLLPSLEEIRELMYTGRLTIAAHNTELLEEIRHYHRDHDYRVSKQRDDLISAFTICGVMMKHRGKPRWECEGIGSGRCPMPAMCRAAAASQRATGSRDRFPAVLKSRPRARLPSRPSQNVAERPTNCDADNCWNKGQLIITSSERRIARTREVAIAKPYPNAC